MSPDDEAQADTGSSVTPSTNPSEHNTKSEDWLDVPEPDRIEVRTQAFSDGGDEGPDSAAAIVIRSRQGLSRVRHLDAHLLWVQ